MKNLEKIFAVAALIIGAIILVAVIITVPLYFLWNWLMPTIFGLNKITLLQVLGLALLSSILFKTNMSKK